MTTDTRLHVVCYSGGHSSALAAIEVRRRFQGERPDIWLKAKWAEDEIGYAIHHEESGPVFLEDMEPKFADMKAAGIEPTEKIGYQRFWANARKVVAIHAAQSREMPCECAA